MTKSNQPIRYNTACSPIFSSPFSTLFSDPFFKDPAFEALESMLDAISGNRKQISDIFKNKVEYPKTDIYTQNDNLIFEMAIPGVDAKEIDVEYEENVLSVKHTKTEIVEKTHKISCDSIPCDCDLDKNTSKLTEDKLNQKCSRVNRKNVSHEVDTKAENDRFLVNPPNEPVYEYPRYETKTWTTNAGDGNSSTMYWSTDTSSWDANEKKFITRELKKGSFSRRWNLSAYELDLENTPIKSELKNGILKVIVPLKKNAVTVKKVKIDVTT